MTLFGRKKDYTEQFDTPISPEAKQSWVAEVSQRNLLTQWSESLLRVEELFTETVLYYPEKQPEVLKALHRMKAEWLKVDRELVTTEEAVILYDVLHKEVPALIYRFGLLKSTRASSNKNHEDDYLDLQRKLEQLLSHVLTVRAKVDAQKLSRFKNLHPENTTTHLTGLTWPVFENAPEEVAEKLTNLQRLWSSQKEKVHTVEDEYLLERIVTDYIPSSLSLYTPFVSASSDMEAAARAALMTQLGLIQNHLEGVAERSFREQMKSVNAQTEFLKDRLDT